MGEGFLFGLWLVVLGALGAASVIIAKQPKTKDLISKLTPYQGWIGAVSALIGLLWTLRALMNMGNGLRFFFFGWVLMLVSGLVMAALGFILGIGVLKSFIKEPQANQKMDELIHALAPYQTTLGVVSVGLGVWAVINSIFVIKI